MTEPIWLATHGGLFSGKTTIAEFLRDEHGFKYFSYTDMLKAFAIESLRAVGVEVSLAQMKADKEKYRQYLIELARLIGYDEGYGLEELCARIADTPELRESNIVIDTLRAEAQIDILSKHGFRLLRVVTPIQERRRRARALGLTDAEFTKKAKDPTENPLMYREGEIQVIGNGNLHAIYDQIVEAYRTHAA